MYYIVYHFLARKSALTLHKCNYAKDRQRQRERERDGEQGKPHAHTNRKNQPQVSQQIDTTAPSLSSVTQRIPNRATAPCPLPSPRKSPADAISSFVPHPSSSFRGRREGGTTTTTTTNRQTKARRDMVSQRRMRLLRLRCCALRSVRGFLRVRVECEINVQASSSSAASASFLAQHTTNTTNTQFRPSLSFSLCLSAGRAAKNRQRSDRRDTSVSLDSNRGGSDSDAEVTKKIESILINFGRRRIRAGGGRFLRNGTSHTLRQPGQH